MTYKNSQMSLLEDTHASHSLSPGSDEARKMTAISGRKCSDYYRKPGPVGSLVKMLLGTSVWGSTKCYLTWKVKTTKRSHLLFQLAVSMPRTGEIDYGLLPTPTKGTADKEVVNSQKGRNLVAYAKGFWPTPTVAVATQGPNIPDGKRGATLISKIRRPDLWPTPRANDAEKRGNFDVNNPRNGLPAAAKMYPTPSASMMTGADMVQAQYAGSDPDRPNYQEAKKLFATPTQRDHKSGKLSAKAKAKRDAQSRGKPLNEQIGGQLNPQWVEWLMGYPEGWTDLNV